MSPELKNDLYLKLVHGNYELGTDVVEQAKVDTELNCLLVLSAIVKNRFININSIRNFLSENQDWRADNNSAVCHETKAMVAYIQGNMENASNHCLQALELNQNAFFARSILAKQAMYEGNYQTSIRYYREILNIYPSHNNTLLNLAEVLLYAKGDYSEILGYIKMSKKSFRRDLYLLLVPFGKSFTRFIWLVTTLLLFSIPIVGNYIFLLLTIILVAIGLITIKKIGLDAVIILRLFGLQFFTTLVWILSLFTSR